jgi:hypothetical protein
MPRKARYCKCSRKEKNTIVNLYDLIYSQNLRGTGEDQLCWKRDILRRVLQSRVITVAWGLLRIDLFCGKVFGR